MAGSSWIQYFTGGLFKGRDPQFVNGVAVSPSPYDLPARTSNRSINLVYKSGPLYISSTGLGFKSWKRRWFLLTRTSLVFFKSDPITYPSKGGDMNLTLGGIDLNNSGRVLVRAEKKLLTVLFSDGRAFTLKAETLEDVDEWKDALERALQAAPTASTLSNSPSFQTEDLGSIDGSSEPGLTGSNRRPVRAMVVGMQILLALEDIDGSPSFPDKALTFIETYAQTARHYLRLSTECMERVRMRIFLEDSKSTDVKFNQEQCKYLATKLEWTLHCALLEDHFPEIRAAPEDAAKCLELYMILFMLAKEVEDFIERCSKENWMQAAVILTNMSDHIWSLSFDLELCTRFFTFKKSRCLTLEEFSVIRSLELKLVKEKALMDDETLSACVNSLIESSEASDDHFELATILLARIDRSRQQSPHLGTSESSQSSRRHARADISSLKYGVRIGKGGSGTVYEAIWCGVGVAVKTFHGPENPEFRKEVSICARVSHPNTASLLFYGVENGECSIVMELMDEDLHSLMRTRLRCNRTRESPFCMFVVLDLMLQIAEGMSYLHKLRIVHRDLKSYNILVRCLKSTEADGHEYVHAKVSDFGLSRTKETSMTCSNQTPNMVTTRWMAPEMFEHGSPQKEAYPFKSDVYSFAMVCYEILTGKFPFTTVSSNAEVRMKVLAGDRPELPDQCPSKLRRLIERCWSPEARARPRFADICLELAYLKSLQTSWSSVGTSAMSNSVACVHPAAAIKVGDVADRPSTAVNNQVLESSGWPSLIKRELQELLITYSYVIPLKRFVIAYRRRYDKDLNVRAFGVYSLTALLLKVTDVVVLKMTTYRGSVTQMCVVAV